MKDSSRMPPSINSALFMIDGQSLRIRQNLTFEVPDDHDGEVWDLVPAHHLLQAQERAFELVEHANRIAQRISTKIAERLENRLMEDADNE